MILRQYYLIWTGCFGRRAWLTEPPITQFSQWRECPRSTIRTWRGVNRRRVSRIPWNGRPPTIEALTTAKQTIARALLQAFPPVAPGCLNVLSTLVASGRRLALVTSASAGTVRLFLDASGTATLFEVIVSGHHVALAKPAPDIYKLALGKMGAHPKQAAVVRIRRRCRGGAGRRRGGCGWH